uniref:Complement factor H-like n=1 Tax=Labrus bergylta TaxID=56723 RepID=A0A3Q3EYG7_9LABR|nr:complement factor H-like [Labrus bergylta]
MWVRYLGFVILFGLPGALHAQPCGAPGLDGGYFVPLQETYSHEIEITYACDSGRKPAVEGWWATSTCQNGVWSPEPQCIGEEDCLPPEIPNAKFNKKQNSWYNEGNTIRVTCDNGYELKNRDATAVCLNGTWTSVPVCEISNNTCGEPPQIPHAVIIGQKYQASFAADSKVRYKCEDGYSVEGAESKKSIFCISGSWSELPKCSRGTRQNTGHSSSVEVTTSAGSGTQTVGGGSGSSAGGTAGGHPTSTESGTQPGGGGRGSGDVVHGGPTITGTTSTGSGTQPVDRGSSTTSVSNDRNSKPAFIPVNECGVSPVIPNGVVVQTERMHLKYECNSYYTRVGPDTVVCTNDGRWSELPSCKEAFCVLDLAQYSGIGIRQTGKEYIKEGETKNVYCSYYDYVIFTCTQGRVTYTQCCEAYYHNYGRC